MRHRQRTGAAFMVAMIAVSCFVAACAGSDTSAPIETGSINSLPPVSQVALARVADTLLVDRSLRLTAILPASHSPFVVPDWSSSDTTVALVTPSGQVFGLKSGSAVIRVSVGSSSASTKLTVRPSIRLVRFEADTLALGLSQTVAVPYRAIDSDGNPADLTQRAVQWNSSAPDVASVSGVGGVVGRLLGSADVRLSVDGQASFLRVHVKPQSVSRVGIDPAAISPAVGDELQLKAVITDASGTVLSGRLVTWSSSNPGVATVNGSGMVAALAAGSAKISAVSENKRAFLSFTVRQPGTAPTVDTTITTTPPPVGSVSVSISSTAVLVGQTAQASAVVKDTAARVLTDRTVSWTTSDESIASVSASGLVTGLKAGSAVITAAVDGKAANVVVVVSTPVLAPKTITVSAPATLKVGDLVQATAVVKDANGTIIHGAPITWGSTPSSVAAVTTNGSVIGRSAGSASVSASTAGLTHSVGVTVLDTVSTGGGTGGGTDTVVTPTVARVAVTLSKSSLVVGANVQATATAYDANGQVMTGNPVTWSSSSTAIASVTTAGLVSGVAPGSATISATISGKIGSASITVTAPVLAGTPIYPGESIQAKVTAAPAGTTFIIKTGTHLRQSVIPKSDDVFLCEPGAILDGQNATSYAIGETSIRSYRVTVRGCTIQNYRPTYEWMGALGNDGATDWLIEGNVVRNSSAAGIRAYVGMRVLNNTVYANAVNGISAYKAHGALIQGNDVYGNGFTPDTSPATASRAGMKIVGAANLIVRRNTVRDNGAIGIWFDLGGRDVVVDSNVVTGNASAGIWLEITYGGIVRGNRVTQNGGPTGSWLTRAGIQVTNSPNVEVVGNIVSGNANGITGMQTSGYPAEMGYGPLLLQNLNVHDNDVSMSVGHTGIVQNDGNTSVFTSWNNRFASNRYTLNGLTAPFAWAGAWRSVSQWQSYGHDAGGTFR